MPDATLPLRPFEDLTPAVVLDALQALGHLGDGRLLQLNSFENRVFQVMLEDGSSLVAKFYRQGRWTDLQILEEHAFAREAAAEDLPVAAPLVLQAADASVTLCGSPPTLAHYRVPGATSAPWRVAVWERAAGRAPELEDPAVLRRLGATLGRLHQVGARADFTHRVDFLPGPDTAQAMRRIAESGQVPADQWPAWSAICEQACQHIASTFDLHRPRTLRIHGDCHPGNLLWRDGAPNLLDFDDTCRGPAIQDLWMLLPGDAGAASMALDGLLEGYESWRAFDRQEIALIEVLRLARMIRHNAWVAARWDDPAFPTAYPGFGGSAYWAQQTAELREQLGACMPG